MTKDSDEFPDLSASADPLWRGAAFSPALTDSPPTAPSAGARPLVDTARDIDSCGIGFIANINGERSHRLVEMGIEMLVNLEHRGACGCDPRTGDGAGLLIQIPHEFFKKHGPKGLTKPGEYAVGMVMLPTDPSERRACEDLLNRAISEEKQNLLGWRDVPVNPDECGELSREVMPVMRQVFIGRGAGVTDDDSFERKLYVIRKRAESLVRKAALKRGGDFYVCSLSCRTIVYKGQLISYQIPRFFADFGDSDLTSAMAMVHQRFSTNTFPSWKRAHPYRYIVHNGEINTLRGNINWMAAREKLFSSPIFGDDLQKLLPIVDPDGSDSAMFDNTLELLLHTGRSLPHAVMMMIPEAWQKHEQMDPTLRAFYEYHACLMEPWDGPASIAFTDGRVIGAILDRNGLRPSRYVVTKDGLIILSSEVGVIEVPPEQVLYKERLHPGRMLLVDLIQKRIVSDKELKSEIAARKPYRQWLDGNQVDIDGLPEPALTSLPPRLDDDATLRLQRAFGYSVEDLKILISPMALNGQEAVGSMGTDIPLAVLSEKPQNLFNYFKQLFAQVTNPPIDPLREDLVMSLETTLGAEQNLFEEGPENCHQIRLRSPTLSDEQFAQIKEIKVGRIRSKVVPIFFRYADGAKGLRQALEDVCAAASKAVNEGAQIVILSDREPTRDRVPIPSLLATAAVHHHLIRTGQRMKCGIVVESGEPREVMHFCLLAGYGASAWYPYLAYESIRKLLRQGVIKGHTEEEATAHFAKAVDKGVLKVATKMGISTLQSYRGAQIFEAIGLDREVVQTYFSGTASRIEGIGLLTIAEESLANHRFAHEVDYDLVNELEVGGRYQWRRRGEVHMLNPDTVGKLQHAVRSGGIKAYREYTKLLDDESAKLLTLRSLLKFKKGNAIPLEEVEPAKEIVKRFATGAMSLGSISREAHETLAIAMNRIGAKSNTGEGGEDPERYQLDANGDSRRSSIKQVASGRFGVTIGYLANSDDLQIKIAQGAKPGEGGQLPGHKIDDYIARIRYSVPGVGLISPPPHHDIYSIEDIAQLIHDLKNANPRARVHVKLVAEVGVGTVAAGVVKAKADVVLVSGYDGGTGASPLTSIQHAGIPWELGLAETQQVLVENGLRGRCVVQTDGKMFTGRDVAVAALLGAEEFGFSTAPLVTLGCIMMRVCHLNTCPVGIATQDPVLRKKFQGKPEDVINYFFYVAEEVREIMAQLGFRTIKDMVGRVEMLDTRDAIDHWKAKGIDLSQMLYKPEPKNRWFALSNIEQQDHGLDKALDQELIAEARQAIDTKTPVVIEKRVKNSNRCVGTMLSGEIGKAYGDEGLPDDTVTVRLKGTAGQSCGAFLAKGVTLSVEGEANDYCGKGLSGGKVAVFPSRQATFVPDENIIIGNVALYGATAGEAYFNGVAGERFAVRNSGAAAVVEGVGDHGCEYMTKGRVVVLGKTGRNFAAGMSGGLAYVLDEDGTFEQYCNQEMVQLLPLESQRDLVEVRTLIQKHIDFTGSPLAKRILADWGKYGPQFVKVLPMEYRKVLEKQHLDEETMKLASI